MANAKTRQANFYYYHRKQLKAAISRYHVLQQAGLSAELLDVAETIRRHYAALQTGKPSTKHALTLEEQATREQVVGDPKDRIIPIEDMNDPSAQADFQDALKSVDPIEYNFPKETPESLTEAAKKREAQEKENRRQRTEERKRKDAQLQGQVLSHVKLNIHKGGKK